MLILETKLTFIFIKRFSTRKDKSQQVFAPTWAACERFFWEFSRWKKFFLPNLTYTDSRRSERDFNHIQSFLIAQSFPVVEWWKVFLSLSRFQSTHKWWLSKIKEFLLLLLPRMEEFHRKFNQKSNTHRQKLSEHRKKQESWKVLILIKTEPGDAELLKGRVMSTSISHQ